MFGLRKMEIDKIYYRQNYGKGRSNLVTCYKFDKKENNRGNKESWSIRSWHHGCWDCSSQC